MTPGVSLFSSGVATLPQRWTQLRQIAFMGGLKAMHGQLKNVAGQINKPGTYITGGAYKEMAGAYVTDEEAAPPCPEARWWRCRVPSPA